jgi:hypothetical protein
MRSGPVVRICGLTQSSTMRHEAGRGKSDLKSRILCIVRSLPDRLLCSPLAAEQAADSLISRRHAQVHPLIAD